MSEKWFQARANGLESCGSWPSLIMLSQLATHKVESSSDQLLQPQTTTFSALPAMAAAYSASFKVRLSYDLSFHPDDVIKFVDHVVESVSGCSNFFILAEPSYMNFLPCDKSCAWHHVR